MTTSQATDRPTDQTTDQTTEREAPGAVRQWRGVIEEYRDLLDLPDHPGGVPAVTLREGGTPLVTSEWLSGLTGADVWLKVEGDNPTGSFKDRG